MGSGASAGTAVAGDAGDDLLSDALGDLCLDFEDIVEDLAPESFCCPITHELMRNPVVACDGCAPALRRMAKAGSAPSMRGLCLWKIICILFKKLWSTGKIVFRVAGDQCVETFAWPCASLAAQ